MPPVQPIILTIPIVISALVNIAADYRGARRVVYVFKPLTTLLILLVALLSADPPQLIYKVLIIAGLVCSLAGDVFLMLPGNRLLQGLMAFLLAHLFYIDAFVTGNGFRFSLWVVPCALFLILFMRVLWPHTGNLKGPVTVYALAIVAMLWQAIERAAVIPTTGATLAALGAVLFTVSDSALAYNRFVSKFRAAQLLVLGTYWAGQLLIALSIAYY